MLNGDNGHMMEINTIFITFWKLTYQVSYMIYEKAHQVGDLSLVIGWDCHDFTGGEVIKFWTPFTSHLSQ